ncbi:hypothetical protein R3P38DRAFT_3169783 [Favolaschia claudopus]|uniref:Uncharacterized protein n=1 Tax=Favolaschia claudopus TaxID=2862362 RepID=A0AAW0DQR4_9AGAR
MSMYPPAQVVVRRTVIVDRDSTGRTPTSRGFYPDPLFTTKPLVTKVTVASYSGRAEIVDIDREAELDPPPTPHPEFQSLVPVWVGNTVYLLEDGTDEEKLHVTTITPEQEAQPELLAERLSHHDVPDAPIDEGPETFDDENPVPVLYRWITPDNPQPKADVKHFASLLGARNLFPTVSIFISIITQGIYCHHVDYHSFDVDVRPNSHFLFEGHLAGFFVVQYVRWERAGWTCVQMMNEYQRHKVSVCYPQSRCLLLPKPTMDEFPRGP